MALTLSKALSQFLSRAAAILTGPPATLHINFKPYSFTTNQALISIGNSADQSQMALHYRGDLSGKPIRLAYANSTTATSATTASGPSTSVWTTATARFTSASSRDIYVNGGGKVSDATTVSAPTFNRTRIGQSANTAAGNFADSAVEQAVLYGAALSDNMIAQLGTPGCNARDIQPKDIVALYDLQTAADLIDQLGANSLTANGGPTTDTGGAPIGLWTRQAFLFIPAPLAAASTDAATAGQSAVATGVEAPAVATAATASSSATTTGAAAASAATLATAGQSAGATVIVPIAVTDRATAGESATAGVPPLAAAATDAATAGQAGTSAGAEAPSVSAAASGSSSAAASGAAAAAATTAAAGGQSATATVFDGHVAATDRATAGESATVQGAAALQGIDLDGLIGGRASASSAESATATAGGAVAVVAPATAGESARLQSPALVGGEADARSGSSATARGDVAIAATSSALAGGRAFVSSPLAAPPGPPLAFVLELPRPVVTSISELVITATVIAA